MLEQLKTQKEQKALQKNNKSEMPKVDEMKESIAEQKTLQNDNKSKEPKICESIDLIEEETTQPKYETKESIDKDSSSNSSSESNSDSSDSSTDDDSDSSPQLSKSWFMPKTITKPPFHISISSSLTNSGTETTDSLLADTVQPNEKVESKTDIEATIKKSPEITNEDSIEKQVSIVEKNSELNDLKPTSSEVVRTSTDGVESPTEATNVDENVLDENKEERGSSPDIGPDFLKKPKLRGPVGEQELDIAIR